MNQILENRKNRLLKKRLYIIQFYAIVAILLSLIIHMSLKKISEYNLSKISEMASSSYNITRLYSTPNNSNLTTNNSQIPVIGTIEIPTLNISYPIFSNYSDELLKISVCKFYGPNINTPGNLCIIGHNYNNGNFFSNLYKLHTNDTIDIYDLNSNKVSYYIYEFYEVEPNNLEYLDQNTERKKKNYFNYL